MVFYKKRKTKSGNVFDLIWNTVIYPEEFKYEE